MFRIQEILDKKGMSFTDLAVKMNKNRSSLYTTLFKGNPTTETLKEVAKALDVNIVELFAKEENDYEIYNNTQVAGYRFKKGDIIVTGMLPHINTKICSSTIIIEEKKHFYGINLNQKNINDLIEIPVTEYLNGINAEKDRIFINFKNFFTNISLENYQFIVSGVENYIKEYLILAQKMDAYFETTNFNFVENCGFKLMEISTEQYHSILNITKKHDLDQKIEGYHTFNHNTANIYLYNKNRADTGVVFSTIVRIIESDKTGIYELFWKKPDRMESTYIKTGEVFSALKTYDFLKDLLLKASKKQVV